MVNHSTKKVDIYKVAVGMSKEDIAQTHRSASIENNLKQCDTRAAR